MGWAWRSMVVALLILAFLMLFTGLRIEWRGGYLPALTWHRTRAKVLALPISAQPERSHPAIQALATNAVSDWPGFRGPARDGIVRQPLMLDWPASGLPLLWRVPCGSGYGSFAVAGGLAYTLEQREQNEVLIAYDLENGAIGWSRSWPGHFQEYFAGEGPRSTPLYDEGRIYALGALGQLGCYNARDGTPLWTRNILVGNPTNAPSYGMASSPLIVGDKLVAQAGGGTGGAVICLNKTTGQNLWSCLDDAPGYASPALVQLAGKEQLIVCCARRTVGLDPDSGKLLWEYAWRVGSDQMPIAQPVLISSNRFMLSGGYFTGCALVEISEGPSGFTSRTIWKNKNLKNKFTSSIFYDGAIYGLDEDILTCLNSATGERKWKDGRYGYGQILLLGNKLLVLSGSGELALVEASRLRHHELARFQAIQGKTWNHPAVTGDRILVRNGAEIACYRISTPSR